MDKLITVPFGWLLSQLYGLTGSYGLAIIIFAVIVQLVLLPITAKSKKSMMKMSRISPKMQEIQKKYADDKQKQQEALQKLQQEEGASMGCGGCLWSFIPLLILFPLLTVVREPLVYMLGISAEDAGTILTTLGLEKNIYGQVLAAQGLYSGQYAAQIKEALPNLTPEMLQGINFGFLGLDLGTMPQFNVFASTWMWDWAHIGLFLIPLVSAGQQVLSMLISQRTNNSVITDEKGLEDKEAAKNSQSAQTNKVMMWMMPIMSLGIGFSVPASLSVYWFVGGVIRTVEDVILTKHYRKIYDAEDAERLKKHLEEQALEEEKERLRAEKRAANPDGITQNTSKKKLQRQQQQAEEEARAAAKKEYEARKGILEEPEEETTLSGIPDRPYCKGRAYDPNRYSTENTEE